MQEWIHGLQRFVWGPGMLVFFLAILPLRTFWNNLSQYIAESNKGGNTITNEIKIVINADNKTTDEIADDVINVIVPKIQKCMANM